MNIAEHQGLLIGEVASLFDSSHAPVKSSSVSGWIERRTEKLVSGRNVV